MNGKCGKFSWKDVEMDGFFSTKLLINLIFRKKYLEKKESDTLFKKYFDSFFEFFLIKIFLIKFIKFSYKITLVYFIRKIFIINWTKGFFASKLQTTRNISYFFNHFNTLVIKEIQRITKRRKLFLFDKSTWEYFSPIMQSE